MRAFAMFARIRSRLADRASMRSWMVDANDGIIATAGLLEGFAGAGASAATLVMVGTAATIAGALSLGGSTWAEEATEREAQLLAVDEERAEIATDPADETAELMAYYVRKGLTPDLAAEVADQLMANDALAAQLEAEHGITEVMSRWAPIRAGVGAGTAFVVGALIPLVLVILAPVDVSALLIVPVVVVSVALTSVVVARTGRMRVSRMLARSVVVGVGTVVISYVVGAVVF